MYVADSGLDKIISYAVEADGSLGAVRDEITTGLRSPFALAFSGGRAYVADSGLFERKSKIISYAVEAGGRLGDARDEITTGLPHPIALAFSGGRAYVVDGFFGKIISYPLIQISPPVAPDAPRVAVLSDSEIEIAWNAVSGATHYKLYRATTRSGLFAQVGGEISMTRYRDGELSANTSYYYQLEACNGDECSGRSPEVSTTTVPPIPSTPTAAPQNDATISITWSEVAGATHYKLYRSETSGGLFAQIGGEITATDYVDSDISANTSYYYRLEACGNGGCSGRSPEVSAVTYATGSLGVGRDEITVGLDESSALAFSGGRAYMVDRILAKIISYPVGAGGILGAGREEIRTGLDLPIALAFSGGRAYVADVGFDKIISYPVGAGGVLGAGRDEITSGLSGSSALAFSGGRAYVTDYGPDKIISYPVEADGKLGAGRDEITGLDLPIALAFSGGRAYVADYNTSSKKGKIISYPVEAGGILGAGRDEITIGLFQPLVFAFSGGRAYVADFYLDKIISYPVEAGGELGAGRDEITTGLPQPLVLAFLGGRAYVADLYLDKITSYPRFSSVAFAVAPDAPRVAAQSDSEIEIAWNAVLGATHYKLYRSETSGGLFASVGGDISVTRYLDGGLSAGAYYYQLEACSDDECSGHSPVVSATTAPVMPDAPMAATQSDGAISITWSAVADATDYKLYRATDGGLYELIAGDIDATGYLDSGLTAGVSYSYQLEACNDNGCSRRSPAVSATTAPAMPDAPMAATQSDGAISITWSAVADATDYKLYRATDEGLYELIAGNIDATGYRDSGLTAGASYSYQLEACNDNGCSRRSPAVIVPVMPSAPTAATQSDDAISITWSAVADATDYKLYRATGGGSYELIAGNIDATGYRDSGLLANTSYSYQLEACNGNGCSGRSAAVSATTAPAIPSAPTVAAQSDDSISITWSEVADATHYKLYRSATSGGSYTQIGGDIAATDYLDSGLSVKTAYYYRLEACKQQRMFETVN